MHPKIDAIVTRQDSRQFQSRSISANPNDPVRNLITIYGALGDEGTISTILCIVVSYAIISYLMLRHG